MQRHRFGPSLPVFTLLIALVLGLYEWVRGHPQDVPWTPLVLADPVGRMTVRKIGALHEDFAGCRRIIEAAGQAHEPLPPVIGAGSCGYDNGVRLTNGAQLRFQPAAAASCPMAASLFLWVHQVVQPAARRHFGVAASSIQTFGTYSCRGIGGGLRPSEHASANAIDIAAFHFPDGKRVSVAGDWPGNGPEAAFLRDVRDGACRIFATTLSPDYNAAHRDHLHLDQAARGGFAFCR